MNIKKDGKWKKKCFASGKASKSEAHGIGKRLSENYSACTYALADLTCENESGTFLAAGVAEGRSLWFQA